MPGRLLKILPFFVLLNAACVYRLDIPQGNFFKPEDVAQLQEGMTREQVRFVMGTPMIADPFHPDRWDYVQYVDSQEDRRDRNQRVTVFFSGEVVTRIETEGVDPQAHDAADDGGIENDLPQEPDGS